MSHQFEALYFLISDIELDIKRIKEVYDDIEVNIHPGASFVCVSCRKPSYQRLRQVFAQKFSKLFKEIINLQISTYGNFIYEHWKNGNLIRGLFWAEGSNWDVSGEKEPWETNAWGEADPVTGSRKPDINPEQVYGSIQTYFNLPPLPC